MRYCLFHLLLVIVLFKSPNQAQSELPTNPPEVAVTVHMGLVRPQKTIPASDRVPIGGELMMGRLRTSERAWQQCQCFFRSGVYLNYYNFRNPGLGETFGMGLYFEPLLIYRPNFNLSVRATLGLSYVNRLYDPLKNPNRNFGSHLNGMTGVGVYGRSRLSESLEVIGTLALDYRHISNAGVYQPNQGINLPSFVIGLAYNPSSVKLPDAGTWKAPALSKRWFGRALALWSMRVYPADDRNPETPRRMLGLNLLGGYRLTKAHAISTGLEVLDDGYLWEQMKRANYQGSTKQATWLIGYELWQGHVGFTAHFGYNFLRPGTKIFGRTGYKPATYEKYGLLYKLNNGITLGVVVKAFGEDTKGFQLAVGGSF